jgi:hypothetical protein
MDEIIDVIVSTEQRRLGKQVRPAIVRLPS